MGKKSRRKHNRHHPKPAPALEQLAWQEQDGFHMLMPGAPPTPEMLEELTRQYQEQLRRSPLWGKMVKKYGQQKAEELLKECRAELRPSKPGFLARLLGLFIRP